MCVNILVLEDIKYNQTTAINECFFKKSITLKLEGLVIPLLQCPFLHFFLLLPGLLPSSSSQSSPPRHPGLLLLLISPLSSSIFPLSRSHCNSVFHPALMFINLIIKIFTLNHTWNLGRDKLRESLPLLSIHVSIEKQTRD